MTTIAELRDSVTRPMLLTHAIPRGVLHQTGLTLWEMPASGSGGYMNYLQMLDAALESTFLAAPFRNQPSLTTATRLQALRNDLLGTTHGQLVLAELASQPYSAGNSLLTQNTTFSPSRSAAGVDSYATLEPEITAIKGAWSGALYLHLGPVNNQGFFGGSTRFNVHYALRTRNALTNPFAVVVDPSWSIDPRQHVQQTDAPNADATIDSNGQLVGVTTRPWYHCLYDITHPSVVALIDASIAATVSQHGTTCGYVLHGENQQLVEAILPAADRSQCGLQPFPVNCEACEPVTHYPANATTGFRNYLTEVLGLTPAEIGERWDADVSDITDVDPVAIPFCPGNPVGLTDYLDYNEYIATELALRQYRVAKSTEPGADVTLMQFGVTGTERSWLCGGRGASGDWSGETYEAYNRERDHVLALVADSARLSGDPMIFAVTAPPYYSVPFSATDPAKPPLFRQVRAYTAPMVRAMFRDCLTSGVLHVGYHKCPGVGFSGHAPSVTAVSGELAAIRAMHAAKLTQCGPWQRVCLHVERPEDLRRPKFPGGGGRCSYHLQRRLRESSTPAAIITSDRVLERPHARWWLRRSLLVCPYPADVAARRDSYVPIYPDGAPGAALLIEQTTAEALPAWVQPTPVVTTPIGSVYRVTDAGNPTNVYWLGARHPGPCGTDEMWGHVAHVVHHEVMPVLGALIASGLGQDTWRPTPIQLFDANPETTRPSVDTDLVANSVTDGMTWFVGVANLGSRDREAIVQVNGADAGPSPLLTYPVLTVSVPARDTVWVQIVPTVDVTGSHVQDQIDQLAANADLLAGLGYDLSSATSTLAAAQDLLDDGVSLVRAAAAVMAVSRMCFVLGTWNAGSGQLTVSVRKLGLEGETAHSPIEGADVLVIWPLNGGEHGVSAQTNASGVAAITPGAPAEQRWDFATANVQDPVGVAGDLVHVEVCAPDGAAARVQVELT